MEAIRMFVAAGNEGGFPQELKIYASATPKDVDDDWGAPVYVKEKRLPDRIGDYDTPMRSANTTAEYMEQYDAFIFNSPVDARCFKITIEPEGRGGYIPSDPPIYGNLIFGKLQGYGYDNYKIPAVTGPTLDEIKAALADLDDPMYLLDAFEVNILDSAASVTIDRRILNTIFDKDFKSLKSLSDDYLDEYYGQTLAEWAADWLKLYKYVNGELIEIDLDIDFERYFSVDGEDGDIFVLAVRTEYLDIEEEKPEGPTYLESISESGIIVRIPLDLLPESIKKFNVFDSLLDSDDEMMDVVKSALTGKAYTLKYLYEIFLVSDEGPIGALDGFAEYRVPLSMLKGLNTAKAIVLMFDEDGNYVECQTKVEGNYLVFYADNSSEYFAFTESDKTDDINPKTAVQTATGMMAALLVSTGLVVIVLKKRKYSI